MSKIGREEIARFDAQIKLGHGADVRQALKSVTPKRVVRSQLAELARVLRRLQCFSQALRFLHPVVWHGEKLSPNATALEVLEYATVLTFLGAPARELDKLLEKVDEKHYPQKYLIWTSHYVSQWDYECSVPYLEKYVSHPLCDEYVRRVGKVNLVASQIVSRRLDESEPIIESLLKEARKHKLGLMKAHVLTLKAQNRIYRKQFTEALTILNKAQEHYRDPESLEGLAIRKWQAVTHLYSGDKKGMTEIYQVREQALAGRRWETLRSCDFHVAVSRADEALFDRAYVGTPFSAFRKLLCREFPSQRKLPESYCWFEKEGSAVADLTKEDTQSMPVRLFTVLTKDFYRPIRIPQVHWEMYQSVFDPGQSSVRVRKLVQRCRQWIQRRKWPVKIAHSQDGYTLDKKKAFGIRLTPNRDDLLGVTRTDEIVHLLSDESLKASEIARQLKEPLRTTQLFLKNAVDSGKIARVGQGRSTRYCLKKAS